LIESIVDLGPLHLARQHHRRQSLQRSPSQRQAHRRLRYRVSQDDAGRSVFVRRALRLVRTICRSQIRFPWHQHQYVSQRTAELLGKKPEEVNIIVAHMGNGASLCAVKQGKSVDTTMGFTPLEGVPMGTRSGNIDPAIIEYMALKERQKSMKEITSILNKLSGYLGVSGVSSDSRDVNDAASKGQSSRPFAIDIQAKRIADYIASYYVYMGGADASRVSPPASAKTRRRPAKTSSIAWRRLARRSIPSETTAAASNG
jgi:hypothetical protein